VAAKAAINIFSFRLFIFPLVQIESAAELASDRNFRIFAAQQSASSERSRGEKKTKNEEAYLS
jgi:hypothetical protein